MTCKSCEGDLYPHYGVGPHLCYHRKPGGFAKNTPGQSSNTFNWDNWPDNFFVDVGGGETVEDLESQYSTCGIWTCPDCGQRDGTLFGAVSKPEMLRRLALTRSQDND